MAGITLEQAKTTLNALLALSPTQRRVTIGDRTIEYHSRAEILREIDYWDAKVKELTNSASGSRRSVTVAPGW